MLFSSSEDRLFDLLRVQDAKVLRTSRCTVFFLDSNSVKLGKTPPDPETQTPGGHLHSPVRLRFPDAM